MLFAKSSADGSSPETVGTNWPETEQPLIRQEGGVLVVVPPYESGSLLSAPSLVAGSPVIFDYGPTTGTKSPSNVGCFVNQTNDQNFAEQFSFSQDMLITDIHIYTCKGLPTGVTVHVKVLGTPAHTSTRTTPRPARFL